MLHHKLIITFGLTEEENEFVKKNLPKADYEVFDTDAPTDLIAIGATALIINASALEEDDREQLLEYCCELYQASAETVVWLGQPMPSKELKKVFKVYDSFETVKDRLKYILLNAHSQMSKSVDYSRKLSYGLQILQLIRNRQPISTKAICEETGLNTRTVQRYIKAIALADEHIVYDPSRKGWKLAFGKSVFFGDYWKDDKA